MVFNKKISFCLIVSFISLVVGRCGFWIWDASHPPQCLEAQEHLIWTKVIAVPRHTTTMATLDVRVMQVLSEECQSLVGERLRLSWYSPQQEVRPGTLFAAEVRLRKPWGARNPGGFDYGLWLLGQGYRASGYIRSAIRHHASTSASSSTSSWLSRIRPWRIEGQRLAFPGLLNALALGWRDEVSERHWRLFRATGTVHLMVVSGLHVGVFAGGVYLLAFTLLRLLNPVVRMADPRQIALLISGLAVALLMLQTGLQAPVLRAGLMAFVLIVVLLIARRTPVWRVLLLVFVFAVLLAPRMLLQNGFWLSFAAVAVLLFYFVPRARKFSRVRSFCACQCVMLLGLTPWLGASVGVVPLVSPIANFLTVPVMTVVTIPLAMLGVCLSHAGFFAPIGQLSLSIADVSLAWVLVLLEGLEGRLGTTGYFSPHQIGQGIVASIVMLVPLPRLHRCLALCCWLSLFVPAAPKLVYGDFRITVLDVGQGSAAIVDTRRHRMVVDTGPAFPDSFDSGSAIVLPALRYTGKDHLDYLLVTHADNDHAGGARALIERYPSAQVSGLRQPCVDGAQWHWDGVHFEILRDRDASNRNDASCTLLVSTPRRAAYISGDISRPVEYRLIPRLPRNIDLLIAPHHGSKTSSSAGFVAHVCPVFVAFSAGRRNRYHHPSPEVVDRYEKVGSVGVITGLQGAVTWRSDRPWLVRTQRTKGEWAGASARRCLRD